jgi:hypothetical protein
VSPRVHHLTEERLFDVYLAERAAEPADPPAAEHLADCSVCNTRYAELLSLMETVRREGDAEADAVFTPDRLRAQQQDIARRIALVGRPARVLSFPKRIVRRTITASASRTAPRWIAAAAAAGLFVGVAVGASYQFRWGLTPYRSAAPLIAGGAAPRASRLTPVATRGAGQADIAADDAFLSELEIALDRPRTRELLAFDDFTPHVREVRDQR